MPVSGQTRRARNLIERFFNKIKQYRRGATGYDKLAANYFALAAAMSTARPGSGGQVVPVPGSLDRGNIDLSQ